MRKAVERGEETVGSGEWRVERNSGEGGRNSGECESAVWRETVVSGEETVVSGVSGEWIETV